MPTKKIYLSDLHVGDIILGRKMLWYPQPSMERFPCFIVSKLNLKFNKETFRTRNWKESDLMRLVEAGWIPAYGKFEGDSWECEWSEPGVSAYEGYHVYDIQVLISNPIHKDWNINILGPEQTINSKTYRFEETSKNEEVAMSVRSNLFISNYLPEDLQIEIEAP